MNKDQENMEQIEMVSRFIDCLNEERKPGILPKSCDNSEEMYQLFEAARAVKRMKFSGKSIYKNRSRVSRAFNFFNVKKIIAAVCVIAFIGLSLGLFDTNKQPYNIAYAMVKAYEQLDSISGVLEYRDETGDRITHGETIEFKFKKPNKFTSIHSFNGTNFTKIYDGGEKMYSVWSGDPGRVRVDYMDTEMQNQQLQFLLLKNMAETLMGNPDAVEQKEISSEVVAGRQTQGYEIKFNYNDNITIHRIWVDKELNLPLKWEINYPGTKTNEGKIIQDHKITTCFINFEINPELKDKVFTYQIEDGKEYYINTPPLLEAK